MNRASPAIASCLAVEIDLDLMRRFDPPPSHYAEYPGTNRFVEAFDVQAYESWVVRRNTGGVTRQLALCLQLPAPSTQRSDYHGVIARNAAKRLRYIQYLTMEMALHATLLNDDTQISHVHWMGAASAFSPDELREINRNLHRRFDMRSEGDAYIDLDPLQVNGEYLAVLQELGFNRLNFWLKDLDTASSRRENPSQRRISDLIAAARQSGFRSISVSLCYGLPKQALTNFEHTLQSVIALGPHYITLHDEAHMPYMRDLDGTFPAADIRVLLRTLAARTLTAAGYQYLGLDHFAKFDDPLARAQREGRLRHGLCGFSTLPDCDVLALGPHAIGSMGPVYSQNFGALAFYCGNLDRNALPIMRGLELSADDLLRRAVINALTCHSMISKESFAAPYLIDFDSYFEAELEDLRKYEALGLVEIEHDEIRIPAKGRLLTSRICMVFDRYHRENTKRRIYAKTL